MSEASAESTTDSTEAPPAEAPDTGTDAAKLQAEIDKWKTQSRKHEERAKANANAAKELEQLRQASMSEQEKAVDEARRAARAETLREVGTHLVTAEFRAQAAGRVTEERLSELLEDMDMTKYLTEDGQVDAERVARKVAALAPEPAENPEPTWPDLGQGNREPAMALNGDPLLASLKDAVGAQ